LFDATLLRVVLDTTIYNQAREEHATLTSRSGCSEGAIQISLPFRPDALMAMLHRCTTRSAFQQPGCDTEPMVIFETRRLFVWPTSSKAAHCLCDIASSCPQHLHAHRLNTGDHQ
jgi:hypothetical protein